MALPPIVDSGISTRGHVSLTKRLLTYLFHSQKPLMVGAEVIPDGQGGALCKL